MPRSGDAGYLLRAIRDEELYSYALYPRSIPGSGVYRELITRSKFALIRSSVSIGSATRMLEIGCDHGVLLRMLEQLGAECHGVDINADAVEQSRHPRIKHASAAKLPFGESAFDVCISSHVIEHLERPEELLREAARVAKPQGALVLLYPWELFRGMTVIPDLVINGHVPHPRALRRIHRHILTPLRVRRLAEPFGWREERSGRFWGFPYLVPQYFSLLRRV
jgi:SAM-dependent methyltransferase